jgi:hypothetical protein
MHVSWPEIDNFHSLRRQFVKNPFLYENNKVVRYMAKVKLHGTNSGVRINSDGSIHALSRTAVITPEKDNAGFASFVYANKKAFELLKADHDFIIYGEWCGPGIQKGVAVTKIPNKIFAIFSILSLTPGSKDLTICPKIIKSKLVSLIDSIGAVKVIPWFSSELFCVDWSLGADELLPVVNRLNNLVMDVEQCDPFIKSEFGIEGVGEGLVLYPIDAPFAEFAFKAKGEKHTVVAHTRPVQADATVVNSANEFAAMVLPAARLEQGVIVVNGSLSFEKSNIGKFLKWIAADLEKEVSAELEASKLDAKIVQRACSDFARKWYLQGGK